MVVHVSPASNEFGSFCAASVVDAAKPVFHLTCRTFVAPLEISVKFVVSRLSPTERQRDEEFPSACFGA
jgi:hypothetical protein